MSLLKQAILCLVLLAAAGAGLYLYQNPHMAGLARESAATAEGQGARPGGGGGNRIPGLLGGGGVVNVVTAPVDVDAAGETLVALGTAKAVRSVVIYPQVTGIVTEILFTPGAAVEEGAALVRLDDAEQQVALDRARVTLEQAEEALQRARTLAESRTITTVALEEAETAARLAEIEVRAAEIALQRRSLTAPFAGVTGLTDISGGDLVTSSTAITTLDDLSTVRVAFEVPERWAGRIAPGQAITATAQGLPGSEFAGEIVAIDNRIDEATRTLRLEADLANEGQALKSGMAVNVELRFDTAEQLIVPTLSVQWDRRGSYVWKVVDSAARRAEIDILRRESGVVIVQGDLQAGEKIVVEGIQRLREGARVAEVNVEPAMVEEAPPPGRGEPAVSGGEPARTRS
jgi:RND family efflux transporter MFP subunit